jgi:hypothetical protein
LKSKDKEAKLILSEPTYSENGDYAVTEIRSLDNKDRWIVQLNL